MIQARVDSTYIIDNISLEYDMVTQLDLARQIKSQYLGRFAVLYGHSVCHRRIALNKKDTLWNISINVPAK